ncbi:hypothetical protein ACI3L3_05135 [Desulfobaculum sp. SPO524]|uniref:hypothetical protein n=1 Tax=Desulfobaculum sp. SPO524 TaxID=3378071 RepID=UPI003851AA33
MSNTVRIIRYLLWCLVGMLIIFPFIFSAYFSFPYWDDFERAHQARYIFDIYKAIERMGWSWWVWSGRFTHHFFVTFFAKGVLTSVGYFSITMGVLLIYFVSFFGILNELSCRKDKLLSLLGSILCLSALLTSHMALDKVYYLATDSLGIGIGSGFVLTFIWSQLRLWNLSHWTSKDVILSVSSGALAIGSYEHSGLAVLLISVISLFFALYVKREKKKVFFLVFKWIVFFFLLSFCARGNFRRQTKRSVGIEDIFENLGNLFSDWISYGFWAFDCLNILVILLIGVFIMKTMCRDITVKKMPSFVLAVISIMSLTLSIVFLHALSDITIGEKSKLSANVALLVSYLLLWTFLILLKGSKVMISKIPVDIPCALILICFLMSPNFQTTAMNVFSGRTGLYGVEQSRRYEILSSSEGRDVQVSALSDIVYPASFGDGIPRSASTWPAKDICKTYNLKSVRSELPKVKLVESNVERGEQVVLPRINASAFFVPKFQAGSNETFMYDWLVLYPNSLVQELTVLTLTQNAAYRPVPEGLVSIMNNAVLQKNYLSLGVLERFACVPHVFSRSEWSDKETGAWTVPVNIPGVADVVGLYVSVDGKNFVRVFGE